VADAIPEFRDSGLYPSKGSSVHIEKRSDLIEHLCHSKFIAISDDTPAKDVRPEQPIG
jgi:hypothetical protein